MFFSCKYIDLFMETKEKKQIMGLKSICDKWVNFFTIMADCPSTITFVGKPPSNKIVERKHSQ